MIKIVEGDILDAPKGSFVFQQVNCQNAMGRGLANAISAKYPFVKTHYHMYCEGKVSSQLLGKVQVIPSEDYTFVNIFGQLTYGTSGIHTNYKAVENCFIKIVRFFENSTVPIHVAIPHLFGCGLAGGDWDIVYPLIHKYFSQFDVTIYSLKPLDLRCGITERGDVAFECEWSSVTMPNINIVITKNLTDAVISDLVKFKHKCILHHTVTGYGSTKVEPLVPSVDWSLSQCKKLVAAGFPTSQIVLRVDPVIPTPKGISLAKDVMDAYTSMGISRLRFSFLDIYPHVRERFHSNGIPCPWEGFTAPSFMIKGFLKVIDGYREIYSFESCSEYIGDQLGCVSEKDYVLLGLPVPQIEGGFQRKSCRCLGTKKELLKKAKVCGHQCVYCYWKD